MGQSLFRMKRLRTKRINSELILSKLNTIFLTSFVYFTPLHETERFFYLKQTIFLCNSKYFLIQVTFILSHQLRFLLSSLLLSVSTLTLSVGPKEARGIDSPLHSDPEFITILAPENFKRILSSSCRSKAV